jgi:hypothetical protein
LVGWINNLTKYNDLINSRHDVLFKSSVGDLMQYQCGRGCS